jgi:cobalt-zinc-cadmium efflux system outer membrane protein
MQLNIRRFIEGTTHLFGITIVFLLFTSCTSYHPLPLDEESISKELKAPDITKLRINTSKIDSKLLKPVHLDDRDGISPDEAAILAVIGNKELRSLRDKKNITSAELLQAGILPNPQLSYTLDFPTGGATAGATNAFGLNLGWDIRALITHGANIESARKHASSIDLDIAWNEWQIAEAAKEHVYRIYFLQKQLDVAKEEVTGLIDNTKSIKKAVEYGDMTVVDLSAAESALKSAQLTVEAIKKQIVDERIALNQSIGFLPNYIIRIQQNIKPPLINRFLSYSDIVDHLQERRLDLLALKIGYESQEARVRAAVLGQFPRLNIGFTQARDNSNIVSSGFGITIDLPIFDRNQGRIAIERATRKQLFDEYINRVSNARSNIAVALSDMNSVERQIDTTEESVQSLKTLVDSYYKAFLEGNADVITYYNARKVLISKQIDVFKLKQNLTDLVIALEIESGQYFEQGASRKGIN